MFCAAPSVEGRRSGAVQVGTPVGGVWSGIAPPGTSADCAAVAAAAAARGTASADFEASAGQAAGLLRLLGNEKRLMVLCQLADGELPVGGSAG